MNADLPPESESEDCGCHGHVADRNYVEGSQREEPEENRCRDVAEKRRHKEKRPLLPAGNVEINVSSPSMKYDCGHGEDRDEQHAEGNRRWSNRIAPALRISQSHRQHGGRGDKGV